MRKMKSAFFTLCAIVLALPNFLFSATACTKAYFPWKWDNGTSSPIQLSVQMCSQDFFDSAYAKDYAFVWNGISSKINVGPCTFAGDTDDNPANINLHSVELTGTTTGLTHLYKKVSGKYVEVTGQATTFSGGVAQARVDLNPILLQDEYKWLCCKTITHEIGHCLALSHPISNDCTAIAVMQQSSTSYFALTIQQHDKDNLIAKWGK